MFAVRQILEYFMWLRNWFNDQNIVLLFEFIVEAMNLKFQSARLQRIDFSISDHPDYLTRIETNVLAIELS